MIKYLGSKKKLIKPILGVIKSTDAKHILDLFSGTSRVSYALKEAGFRVSSNDLMQYAFTIAKAKVEVDSTYQEKADKLIAELNAIKPVPGWFTNTYCVESRFFQPHNGEKVDAIREHIAKLSLSPEEEVIALTALMEAADKVDSTVGLQMAYLKSWAKRSFNEMKLTSPLLLTKSEFGPCKAYNEDALKVSGLPVDLVYLDPPYNQHSYLGNYHIWESLVKWDKPEVYGIAKKRVECRTNKSLFNLKREAKAALSNVVSGIKANKILVSFSNEGFLSFQDLSEICLSFGSVKTFAFDYKRHVCAQIGIHNHLGDKVGEVSHLNNVEYLFLAER